MRLGGSLARRRGKRGRRRRTSGSGRPQSGDASPWTAGPRLFLLTGVLAALGWAGGYLLSTRVAFPAPPPPGDLFEVPEIRGLTLTRARDRLTVVGLDLGIVDSLQHPTVAESLILGQSPLPGQLAAPGGGVGVTVSRGPQLRSVPDVLRLDHERARVVLETTGFVVRVDSAHSDVPAGRVVEVSPPPESVVALPAGIDLLVSMGPPLVTMPLLLGLRQADAERLLTSLGLVISEIEEVFRFGRDQGIVVVQSPAAETVLERGSAVRLSVGRRARREGTMPSGSRSLPRLRERSPDTIPSQLTSVR